MSTGTEEYTESSDYGNPEEYKRNELDAPEGQFRFTLIEIYPPDKSRTGKRFYPVAYRLDQVAEYDENGDLRAVDELSRPYRVFHKFWIDSSGGNKHFAAWLSATIGIPTGELDPESNEYRFNKYASLQKTLDMSAWNSITHKNDPEWGWDINVGFKFQRNPRNRIKPINGATS